MRIFVTGSSGLIGGAVMRAGRERGHEMTGLDRNASTDRAIVSGNIDNLDLLVEASRGADAVVHAAAMHSASTGLESDQAFYNTNILGSANVFEAALQNRIGRFVFCSSLEVLSGPNWQAGGIVKYSADTPVNLSTVYGACKYMIEQMGHYYHNARGLQFCALRYTNVAWSCTRPREMNPPTNLLGRDITVEDCAEASLLACETEDLCDDVFLIGQDTPLTSSDLVRAQYAQEDLLEDYWPGCLQLLIDAGFPTQRPIWPLTDVTPAKQILRWKPKHDFSWFLDCLRNGLRAEEAVQIELVHTDR